MGPDHPRAQVDSVAASSRVLFFYAFFSRSCSSSQTSWRFLSFITSSSPSHSTSLWRCRSFSAPFLSAGTWTFTTRRATRRPRSTPPTSTKSWGRYGLDVLERIPSTHHFYTVMEKDSQTPLKLYSITIVI